jgi:hypothetical protein
VNAFAALCVWGVLGLVLAVLARSSAIAISVGVGYVLVVESIVKMAATGSSHFSSAPRSWTATRPSWKSSLAYLSGLGTALSRTTSSMPYTD